jgi:acetyltransferase-like isoleucine patch superfamily enzyme
VRIGEGARVAPGTVVNRDLPPGSLATGNPMRVVRAAEPDTGAAAD